MQMIVKHRDVSTDVFQLEALSRRLPCNHKMKKRIETDLRRKLTGLRGEKEVDYPLGFLEEDAYYILHDLRLPDQNGYFQIDTLIISRKYILILEVKNWYGTVLFGENGQVTRVGDDGVEEGFSNPISQSKIQQFRMRKWLESHSFYGLPVTYLVVMSFPSTLIKSASSLPIPTTVIHNNKLMFKILELDKEYTIDKQTISEIKVLANRMIAAHTPSIINVLSKYSVGKDELIRGVFCTMCYAIPMIRGSQKWHCLSCSHKCTDAHLSAYNDYLLLLGLTISNRETREFLCLDSPYVTKRLLQKAGFTHTGVTKDRVYQLEFR